MKRMGWYPPTMLLFCSADIKGRDYGGQKVQALPGSTTHCSIQECVCLPDIFFFGDCGRGLSKPLDLLTVQRQNTVRLASKLGRTELSQSVNRTSQSPELTADQKAMITGPSSPGPRFLDVTWPRTYQLARVSVSGGSQIIQHISSLERGGGVTVV